jgi:hypothetical protein
MARGVAVRFSEKLFRSLWADTSVSIDEIADRFGTGRRWPALQASRLGLPSRHTGPRQHVRQINYTDLARLWNAGLSPAAIAKALGMRHRQYVWKIARRIGLPPRPVGRPAPYRSLHDLATDRLRDAMARTAAMEQAQMRAR